jgi:anti-sigma B factor antagonist
MNIHTTKTDETTIMRLQGRFDSYEGKVLTRWLEGTPNVRQLVVNMTEVDFLDSSALSLLVQVMRLCRQNGSDIHLCGLQKPVITIFELTRLDKVFRIFEDETAAIKAFSDERPA